MVLTTSKTGIASHIYFYFDVHSSDLAYGSPDRTSRAQVYLAQLMITTVWIVYAAGTTPSSGYASCRRHCNDGDEDSDPISELN